MTTITPELRSKIERRARRAWRAHRDGVTRHISRVSDVSETELKYRLPNTPDYYGKEKIRVVRHPDGTIEVDPKTTGLIDCRVKDDLDRLKKHGDTVRAYVTVRQNGDVIHGTQKLKLGKDYKAKTVRFKSRAQCLEEANPGDRVLVVELHADNIDSHTYGAFEAKIFAVVDELDQEKDLGFTVGLLDCRSKSDLDKVKKHIGTVRAYLLKKRAKKPLTLGKKHTLATGERFTSRKEAIDAARPGDRVYSAEFDFSEIEKRHTDGLTATAPLLEELDPEKDLGFTVGTLLDLKTNADIEKLRKHVGPVRGYKYVTKDLKSPTQTANAILYEVGKEFEEKDADTNPNAHCAKGINVASQEWCKSYIQRDHRALAFEFDSADIAAIPTDGGKLRVFRCLCVEEVDTDKFEPLPGQVRPTVPPPVAPPTDVDLKSEEPKKKGFFDRLFGSKEDDAPGV